MNIRRLMLWCSVFIVATIGSPATHAQAATTRQGELRPTRPECEILLPERDEPNDLAELIRADQFLRCERDGFRRDLAPPWKTETETHDKLVDACDYFARSLQANTSAESVKMHSRRPMIAALLGF